MFFLLFYSFFILGEEQKKEVFSNFNYSFSPGQKKLKSILFSRVFREFVKKRSFLWWFLQFLEIFFFFTSFLFIFHFRPGAKKKIFFPPAKKLLKKIFSKILFIFAGSKKKRLFRKKDSFETDCTLWFPKPVCRPKIIERA